MDQAIGEPSETTGQSSEKTAVLNWEMEGKLLFGKMARTRIFKNLVPRYFHLKPAAKSHCAEMWSNQGWNLSFRRPLNDWEIQRLVEFYKVLWQFKGTIDAQDSLVWQDHNRDNFSVSRAYKKCNPYNSQGNGWPWKLIWKTKIPYKVSCFTWLLAKQAV